MLRPLDPLSELFLYSPIDRIFSIDVCRAIDGPDTPDAKTWEDPGLPKGDLLPEAQRVREIINASKFVGHTGIAMLL